MKFVQYALWQLLSDTSRPSGGLHPASDPQADLHQALGGADPHHDYAQEREAHRGLGQAPHVLGSSAHRQVRHRCAHLLDQRVRRQDRGLDRFPVVETGQSSQWKSEADTRQQVRNFLGGLGRDDSESSGHGQLTAKWQTILGTPYLPSATSQCGQEEDRP